MASFAISTPSDLDAVKITIQDDSPTLSRVTQGFTSSSPGGQSFVATSMGASVVYPFGPSITLGQPTKMVSTSNRPSTGQVYPRTI